MKSTLTWLQDLNDDTLTVGCVDPLVDLRVLSTADLFYDLVVLLRSIHQSPIISLKFWKGIDRIFHNTLVFSRI